MHGKHLVHRDAALALPQAPKVRRHDRGAVRSACSTTNNSHKPRAHTNFIGTFAPRQATLAPPHNKQLTQTPRTHTHLTGTFAPTASSTHAHIPTHLERGVHGKHLVHRDAALALPEAPKVRRHDRRAVRSAREHAGHIRLVPAHCENGG